MGTENSTSPVPEAPAAAAGQSVPAWCQYVPVPFQGVACRGSSAGCSCQSFCNGHKDVNNPECCGCGDGGAAAAQQHVAAPASQMYMLRGNFASRAEEPQDLIPCVGVSPGSRSGAICPSLVPVCASVLPGSGVPRQLSRLLLPEFVQWTKKREQP